ncbi:MAG: formylmethanofuran--tetrahydromethanopterin N-formyltransferase, partial [Gammaproteobacteria bacterium]
MQIHSTQLIDTFAEAFKMWGSRVIITGETSGWALAAARS